MNRWEFYWILNEFAELKIGFYNWTFYCVRTFCIIFCLTQIFVVSVWAKFSHLGSSLIRSSRVELNSVILSRAKFGHHGSNKIRSSKIELNWVISGRARFGHLGSSIIPSSRIELNLLISDWTKYIHLGSSYIRSSGVE